MIVVYWLFAYGMFVNALISVFVFKQKTAYEMRISDWSSDVCSADLQRPRQRCQPQRQFAGKTGNGLIEKTLVGRDHIVNFARARHIADEAIGNSRASRSLFDVVVKDRKSTRLNPVTNAHLVCRLLLEKKKKTKPKNIITP